MPGRRYLLLTKGTRLSQLAEGFYASCVLVTNENHTGNTGTRIAHHGTRPTTQNARSRGVPKRNRRDNGVAITPYH